MEIDVKEDKPDDMIREGQFEQPLYGQRPVEAVEWDEAVDNIWNHPLLNQGEHQIGAQDNLHNSSEQK